MNAPVIKRLRTGPEFEDSGVPEVVEPGHQSKPVASPAPFVWGGGDGVDYSDAPKSVGQKKMPIHGGTARETPADVPDQFIRESVMSDCDVREKQLRQDLRRCTRGDLIKRYPAEWNCYRGMLWRERNHGAVIAPQLRSFKGFLGKLGPCPVPGYTIDRRDCLDPEYAPNKVRWASKKTQANNRVTTVMLTGRDGKVRPVTQQAALTGQKPDTIRKRLKRGWTDAEALAGKGPVKNAEDMPRTAPNTLSRRTPR